MSSPAQRSLAYLREQGCQVAVLERWNSYAHIRQDVWGFADGLMCGGQDLVRQPPTLIQWTVGARHAEHRAKILCSDKALVWIRSGGRILLLSWSKTGERGKRKVWTAREEWIGPENFEKGAA